jgi:hypothetical protein
LEIFSKYNTMLFLYNSIECGARKIKGSAFGTSAPQAGFAIAYWQLGFRCRVSGVRMNFRGSVIGG